MDTAQIKRILIVIFKMFLPLGLISLATLVTLSIFLKPNRPVVWGVTFSQKYTSDLGLNWKETYIKTLDDLKVKNIRLIAYWDDIEKQKGVYDFSDLDFMLNEADKRNLNVILAIGRKLPRWPECFEPNWIKGEDEDFIDARLLLLLAKETDHLKHFNSIKYWQVENEPFFPFGDCPLMASETFVKQEIELVKSIDKRPVITSDSGEGGAWIFSYYNSDGLAISMYRKVRLNFWGYFKWPFPPWFYRVKAVLLDIPMDKIINTELQAEPWADSFILNVTDAEASKTMNHQLFPDAINYARDTGITQNYLWGVEWWYYKKLHGDSFYWDSAKKLFTQGNL